MKNRQVKHMVCDLQYGSTGKGALVGFLTNKHRYETAVTAWGTNAGHTYVHSDGKEVCTTQVSTAAHFTSVRNLFVGAGSNINPYLFIEELANMLANGRIDNGVHYGELVVVVHELASIVLPQHVEKERGLVGIGSTSKGNSAAVAGKLSRPLHGGNIARNFKPLLGRRFEVGGLKVKVMVVDAGVYTNQLLHGFGSDNPMIIEGAQGFSLGINQRFYPYCTSRECTPQSVATDCGIPFHQVTKVFGSARTFPIRVANRYDNGEMVGWSGGCYPDQKEINWGDIGLDEPEITTVTKLPRRLFTLSERQLEEACDWLPDGSEIFMNFCNYLGDTTQAQHIGTATLLTKLHENDRIAPVSMVGFGRTVDDIAEVQITGGATPPVDFFKDILSD